MEQEIEDKLLDYFKDKFLTVLDSNRQLPYTGVTVPYILNYVLGGKYNKVIVIDILKKLHNENKLHSLFCPTVNNIVFENPKSNHWNYKEYEICDYDFKKSYKYFEDYLEEMKK